MLCLALLATGCATTEMATVKPVSSGFLGNDYALLTPGETAKGQAGLRYFNPAAQWRRYNKVMIEPVTFWGGALRTAAVHPISERSQHNPGNLHVAAWPARGRRCRRTARRPRPVGRGGVR